MKRSKSIDLKRMRKKRIVQLGSLSAVAGSATLLTGCGNGNLEVEARVYRSLDICKALNYGEERLCELAYRQALKRSADEYPRYTHRAYCLEEFKSCHQEITAYGREYVPDMAGFLLAQISKGGDADSYGDSGVCGRTQSFGYKGACYSSKIVYEGNDQFSDNYYTADGERISRQEETDDGFLDTDVDLDVFSTRHKYKHKKPLSRGGFGKRVIAFASNKSSRSSSSWGG